MKSFNDRDGRSWNIEITVDAIKRVRTLVGVNLLEVIDGKLIDQLAADPILLCDVIYAAVKPQADERQISDEDFGRAMAGDAIERATTAFFDELIDFFPGRRRHLLATAMKKVLHVQDLAITAAEQRLDDPALERQLRELMSSGSSGSSPASPASTPGP